MNEQEYLTERLEDQIQWYDTKSQWNQKWFKRLQVLQLSAAASIPLLSGYSGAETPGLRLAIGILGVLIAVAGAILGVYKFHENWLEYRTTCESLRHEKYLYQTRTPPYDIDEAFDLLVQRVEGLISTENSRWNQYNREVPQAGKDRK